MKRRFQFAKLWRIAVLVLLDALSVWASVPIARALTDEFRKPLLSYAGVPGRFSFNLSMVFLAFTIIIFYAFKMYNMVVRYIGIRELHRIFWAVTVSNFIPLGCRLFVGSYNETYSNLFVIYLLQLIFIIGIRALIIAVSFLLSKKKPQSDRRAMVIGAGDAGRMLVHELNFSSASLGKCCCIIDDDPVLFGQYIDGVQIVGSREDIPAMAKKYHIEEIIIAIPSLSGEESKALYDICTKTGCKLKTMPDMFELLSDQSFMKQVRDVSVEDLLGRESIHIDMKAVSEWIAHKTVMVTGGGGSIGSELCRQIARYHPKKLVIVDVYENNAYNIQQELIRKHPELDFDTMIASVRETDRINKLMKRYQPQIVFHAAAHKHVPLMEDSPNEAIKNNVFGTYKTAQAAIRYGVEKFVLISTDKAVNPTNIMGASKRLCEMVVQGLNGKGKTEFVAVRFGNVLGSNGSVIPLFKKQIAAGGPVTVTHPDIIRYFMTIPEAVSLVLEAGCHAHGGQIFVLDMGAPVRIDDLARNLIRLSGYTPDVDIKIEYTGLRPGEKLFEEMLMSEEGLRKTDNKLIYIGSPIEMDTDVFFEQLADLKAASYKNSTTIKQIVSELVPTYRYDPAKDTSKQER